MFTHAVAVRAPRLRRRCVDWGHGSNWIGMAQLKRANDAGVGATAHQLQMYIESGFGSALGDFITREHGLERKRGRGESNSPDLEYREHQENHRKFSPLLLK